MPVRFDLSALSRRRSMKFISGSLISIVAIVLVTFTVLARRTTKSPATEKSNAIVRPAHGTESPGLQGNPSARSRLHSKLSLQPEAAKLRRRLGQRFLTQGREVAMLDGALKLGGQQYIVRIIRSQEDDGESMAVALNRGPATLTWSDKDGAKSAGSPATDETRALLERLALDSPDQFIMAQLRGASYYTVARDARPVEAGDADNYTGTRWDLVRVAEPINLSQNRPQSLCRLYFINSSTGLIDKVVSQEQGDTITAEISGWVTQAGETIPTRVVWKRNNQTIMELIIANVSHNPKQ
jgi:hypothetical protein